MVTTSTIASSGSLPFPAGYTPLAQHGSTSNASTIAAVNSLLNSGTIAAPATAVTAGKSDSGVGNPPRYAPIDTRSQEEQAIASEPSLADVIGGYSLNGRAFPAILYTSQYFAHNFSQDGAAEATAASSDMLKRALAETASDLYSRAASLLPAGGPSIDSEDGAKNEASPGNASSGESAGNAPAGGGATTTGALPVKTMTASIAHAAVPAASLPGNDNLVRPKLVVSHDRSSLRGTGTGAYRAVQSRNDEQLVATTVASASA